MTRWDFDSSDPVDISVDNWASGSIVVSGDPTSSVVVEVTPSHRNSDSDVLDQVEVTFEDGQLYIHGPRMTTFRRRHGLDLTIKAPAGSTCAAKTASADLTCIGEISAVSLHTASGDLTAESVADVAMRSASGDLHLAKTTGTLSVHSASGDIRAAHIGGEVRITTASGDVAIGYCAGPVTVHTASGDVELSAVAGGRVQLGSTSGDLAVAVIPGLAVYLDLMTNSGDIRSELDPDDSPDAGDESAAALRIGCRTLSGDIKITKARGVPAEPAAAAVALRAPGSDDGGSAS
jgi:DUF4097 and DUF4098 domain-containing protein YvlB